VQVVKTVKLGGSGPKEELWRLLKWEKGKHRSRLLGIAGEKGSMVFKRGLKLEGTENGSQKKPFLKIKNISHESSDI